MFACIFLTFLLSQFYILRIQKKKNCKINIFKQYMTNGICDRWISIYLHLVQMRPAGIVVDKIFQAPIDVYSITSGNLLSCFRRQQRVKQWSYSQKNLIYYFITVTLFWEAIEVACNILTPCLPVIYNDTRSTEPKRGDEVFAGTWESATGGLVINPSI